MESPGALPSAGLVFQLVCRLHRSWAYSSKSTVRSKIESCFPDRGCSASSLSRSANTLLKGVPKRGCGDGSRRAVAGAESVQPPGGSVEAPHTHRRRRVHSSKSTCGYDPRAAAQRAWKTSARPVHGSSSSCSVHRWQETGARPGRTTGSRSRLRGRTP